MGCSTTVVLQLYKNRNLFFDIFEHGKHWLFKVIQSGGHWIDAAHHLKLKFQKSELCWVKFYLVGHVCEFTLHICQGLLNKSGHIVNIFWVICWDTGTAQYIRHSRTWWLTKNEWNYTNLITVIHVSLLHSCLWEGARGKYGNIGPEVRSVNRK